MITFMYGENNYQLQHKLSNILSRFEFKEGIERYEAKDLSPDSLPGILSGLNLFSPQRLIVISGASENKELWVALASYLSLISDDLHLVIVEETVDKRTKTFKDLQKVAQTSEMKEPSENEALTWLLSEAEKRKVKLSSNLAVLIVSRVGLNQWRLHFALEKLVGLEKLDKKQIEDIIETTPQANVFFVIDAALSHQPEKVRSMVATLRMSEDAYFFFGLLASQLFQLVTLASTKKTPAEVAKDIGVHPYPLQKMQSRARALNQSDIKAIVAVIAQCDNQLKRSGVDPWLVLEQALLKLATLHK